jgi:hypothetical protein
VSWGDPRSSRSRAPTPTGAPAPTARAPRRPGALARRRGHVGVLVRYDGDRREMVVDALGPSVDAGRPARARAGRLGARRRARTVGLPRGDARGAGPRPARLLRRPGARAARPEPGPLELDADYDPEVLRPRVRAEAGRGRGSDAGREPTEEALRELGVPEVLVTLGSRGSLVLAEGLLVAVPARPVEGEGRPDGCRRLRSRPRTWSLARPATRPLRQLAAQRRSWQGCSAGGYEGARPHRRRRLRGRPRRGGRAGLEPRRGRARAGRGLAAAAGRRRSLRLDGDRRRRPAPTARGLERRRAHLAGSRRRPPRPAGRSRSQTTTPTTSSLRPATACTYRRTAASSGEPSRPSSRRSKPCP